MSKAVESKTKGRLFSALSHPFADTRHLKPTLA
jgi:hypothetical protein